MRKQSGKINLPGAGFVPARGIRKLDMTDHRQQEAHGVRQRVGPRTFHDLHVIPIVLQHHIGGTDFIDKPHGIARVADEESRHIAGIECFEI